MVPTVDDGILALCFTCTVVSVMTSLLLVQSTEQHKGFKADSDETKKIFGHGRHYHMVVNRRKKNKAAIFDNQFGLGFLPRESFHLVILTVVHDII